MNDKAQDRPLTSQEAAEFLSLSLQTVYNYVNKRKIPCYKPSGGRVYFRRSELEEWAYSKKKGGAGGVR